MRRSRSEKELQAELARFVRPSTGLALSIFAANLAVYGAAVAGTVLLAPLPLKLLCALAAGLAIAALFVIGHDAAHGSFTGRRRLNALIGRIAFLPALHNYSLWQVVHNRLHHRTPNLRGLNSWWPLTKAEYDTLPARRRAVERLYRSPLGFAPYYLVRRWWRDKFFPRRATVGRRRAAHWLDFALLCSYLTAFVAALAAAGSLTAASSAPGAVLWGFAVPFLLWNAAMGATTYMQHTHARVPWFASMTEWERLHGQEEVSVHVVFPRWYGLVSHNIMDHPAHHVHSKIPLYRLRAAQRRLNELAGARAVAQPFSLGWLLGTVARCKLYDYREHRWLDFAGRPTTPCTLPPHYVEPPVPVLAPPAAAVA